MTKSQIYLDSFHDSMPFTYNKQSTHKCEVVYHFPLAVSWSQDNCNSHIQLLAQTTNNRLRVAKQCETSQWNSHGWHLQCFYSHIYPSGRHDLAYWKYFFVLFLFVKPCLYQRPISLSHPKRVPQPLGIVQNQSINLSLQGEKKQTLNMAPKHS